MSALPSPNWQSLADDVVRYLRDLIRLDTSNPPGNEMLAAEYLARVLHAAGIAPVVIETAPKRGNVIARLRGDGGAAPLLLYSHTDVVPVERERWTVDPFGGEVKDGFVYGRGALDMKGITAMQLAVFLAIAQAMRHDGLTLRRDLILAATADEEADTNQGIGLLVERHPDLLRAEYALSEFGGYSLHIGNRRFYPIQTAEKGNVWMRMIARGRPGHASVPHADNAVVHLSRAVDRLARARLPTRITPTARAFIAGLADGIGGGQGVALRAWLDIEALHEVPLHRLVGDFSLAAELYAVTHDTVVPTVLRAGYKTNVVPSSAEATLDCRTLPGSTPDGLIEALRQTLGDELPVEFRVDSSGEAIEFPFDTPLFRLIERALRQHDPQGVPLPYMMTGATDAKHVARLGAICYGFSPMQFAPGESFFEMVHGHDERVAISALAWGARVLYEVVRDFCAAA
ncbi:MAG: M20/M25/M40 family metallo-hydrolase [Thermoflexales bacterium]|nr:M20/M25/M40 family metallo-hydrolase [Thermoflexales bacterium]MDW8350823.1 M20/M25/M40 family metallo-hydrolase [Anaerolineae bacterium]